MPKNDERGDPENCAAGAFGFYLIAGAIAALVIAGLVFLLQR